jgi:AmmeMemoRadiSam system protein A
MMRLIPKGCTNVTAASARACVWLICLVLLQAGWTGARAQKSDRLRQEGKGKMSEGRETQDLSSAERKELLRMARRSIEAHLEGRAYVPAVPASAILKEKRGAFVTLHERGELRGCIGFMQAAKPLYQTVAEMAASAAFHDPRFGPLRSAELSLIEIEISVLSPLVRIGDPDAIVMGKHGVVVERGGASGVFLPQVAAETGWTREQFLDNLCLHKAGLPSRAWRDKDTALFTFTAEVFSEKTEGLR